MAAQPRRDQTVVEHAKCKPVVYLHECALRRSEPLARWVAVGCRCLGIDVYNLFPKLCGNKYLPTSKQPDYRPIVNRCHLYGPLVWSRQCWKLRVMAGSWVRKCQHYRHPRETRIPSRAAYLFRAQFRTSPGNHQLVELTLLPRAWRFQRQLAEPRIVLKHFWRCLLAMGCCFDYRAFWRWISCRFRYRHIYRILRDILLQNELFQSYCVFGEL